MHRTSYGGKFIVFEGLDGSGQTTQANLLKNYLEKSGKKVLLTKEPTVDSEVGRKIERILHHQEEASPRELQELFADDRRVHLEKVIIPALKDGIVVISDRYFFSSFAFGSLGCDLEWLISINNDFLLPDATFVLVVRPETAEERIEKRKLEKTLFEEAESSRQVAENYQKLGDRFKNIIFIDSEQSIGDVHRVVVEKIADIFKN